MKTIKMFYFIGVVAIVFNACSARKDVYTIKVGYLPMVSSLTHFVAEEKGFYKEVGLIVEANPIKTSNLIAQDLVAGHIDAAIELSIVPLLKQLEKAPNTAKIFSISNITGDNGFDGILVKSNSSMTKLEDIAGKNVGVFPGTTAKNSLTEVFKTKYPTVALPKYIELDPPLHIQSLERGDVDALFTYEPTFTMGIIKHHFKKISTSIYALQYLPSPIGVGAINNNYFSKSPESAIKFFQAIDKAVEFIASHPIEARQILAKSTNLDSMVANTMNIMPLSKSDQIDFNNLNGYLEVLKRINEISLIPNVQDICIVKNK